MRGLHAPVIEAPLLVHNPYACVVQGCQRPLDVFRLELGAAQLVQLIEVAIGNPLGLPRVNLGFDTSENSSKP
jgi:hypothetical protein